MIPRYSALPTHKSNRDAGILVWFTGLSGSGKSTLARAVFEHLATRGEAVELLDADQARHHLAAELGFSREDREKNVRRLGFVANLLCRHGVITLVAAMSPYREGRDQIRRQTPHFVEVFVDAPIETCEQRDPVGLYRKFRAGTISSVSGLDEPYERPLAAEVHCQTAEETLEQSCARVMHALNSLIITPTRA